MTETKIEINGILYADYITSTHLDTLVQGNVIVLCEDIVKDNARSLSEQVPYRAMTIPKGVYVVSNVTLLLPSEDRVLHLTRDDNAKSHIRLMVGAVVESQQVV